MMKLINKLKLYLGTSAILFTMSCSVDPSLTDRYIDDVLYSNETNVDLYLNKFYTIIGQSYYSPFIGEDGYTDIVKYNNNTVSQNQIALGIGEIKPSGADLMNWDNCYSWITSCNRFIDGLFKKGGKLSEEVRLRAEAEARFFRALMYFDLAKRFGPTLILHKELPPMDKVDFPLCTADECWDFIAEDLDFGATNLPDPGTERMQGKLTKGAALAIKARAMLYARRWAEVEKAVLAIQDFNYSLYYNSAKDKNSYADLFKIHRVTSEKGNDGNYTGTGVVNLESIIEFAFQGSDFGYDFDVYMAPPGDPKGAYNASPTENLVSEYEMADGTKFDWDKYASNPYTNREPRFYATILYNGAPWKGRTIETFEGGTDAYVASGSGGTCTGYYLRKFMDESMTGTFEKGSYTMYYMRYAEVLLIYAEALAELQRVPEAMEQIKLVRERAKLPTDMTISSYNDCMELIRHERMVELAMEGHRYWDLRRWGLAVKVLNSSVYGVKPTKVGETFTYTKQSVDNGKKRYYPEKYNRFPLPQTEIERNPAVKQYDEWR